jgi:hypothetical protein
MSISRERRRPGLGKCRGLSKVGVRREGVKEGRREEETRAREVSRVKLPVLCQGS